MTSESTSILCDLRDGVARLTLNRPPLNILNLQMMEEITRALEGFKAREEVRLLVLDHQGKAFSAGVDIKDHTPDKVRQMIQGFHAMCGLLGALAAPSLAVVDGPAVGGGCELAVCCDLVVASERATFGQPEIKVGVFAPVAAVILPRLIGRNRALELLLTGAPVEAAAAEKMGLINKVFPSEGFRERVNEFIATLKSFSTPVLKLTKRAVDQTLDASVASGISTVEQIYLSELMRTEDAHEGIEAFLEKRQPAWKHK